MTSAKLNSNVLSLNQSIFKINKKKKEKKGGMMSSKQILELLQTQRLEGQNHNILLGHGFRVSPIQVK